jgi:hypothetical protein
MQPTETVATVRHDRACERLEKSGLVLRTRDSYRLTTLGKRELDMHRALARVVVQLRANTSAAQPSSTAVVACVQPKCAGRSPSR